MRPDRDWLQFDCALSYGLVEYLRTLDVLERFGWLPTRCIPHGGHQMSLNIAAGLGLGGNWAFSRASTWKPISSLRPSDVAPMITSMPSAAGSMQAWR